MLKSKETGSLKCVMFQNKPFWGKEGGFPCAAPSVRTVVIVLFCVCCRPREVAVMMLQGNEAYGTLPSNHPSPQEVTTSGRDNLYMNVTSARRNLYMNL